MGLRTSINAAVRRRESLLASTAVESTPASDVSHPSPDPVKPGHTLVITDAARTTDSSTPLSRSQEIAQAVLSGKTEIPSLSISNLEGGKPNAESTQLAKLLASGAGSQGSPIHVTLGDGKCYSFAVVVVGGRVNTGS